MIRVLKGADFSSLNLGRIGVNVVATPAITATYSDGSSTVSISCGTSGASIYYTTDGTIPSASSTLYNGTFTISSAKTIKAIAMKSGLTQSTIASKLVQVLSVNTITITSANASDYGGTYTAGKMVQIIHSDLSFKKDASNSQYSQLADVKLPDNVTKIIITNPKYNKYDCLVFGLAKEGYKDEADYSTGLILHDYTIRWYSEGSEGTSPSPYSDGVDYSSAKVGSTFVVTDITSECNYLFATFGTSTDWSIEVQYLG